MKKDFIKTLKILLAALVLSFSISYVYAWTAPTIAPPGGNIPTPINKGIQAQVKQAGLTVNAGNKSLYGFNVPYGNVGIGTTNPTVKLDIVGDVKATAFFYSSDRRLKKDITPLSSTFKKIKALQGVSFKWRKNNKKSMGFIAQDVEKIFPELVATNPITGMKSIEYAGIIAPLVETVKEQQKQIDVLNTEVENLKSK